MGADLDHLGTENARLKIELEQYKIANKAADPRERRSLQKIIAGMASGKYGFTLCAPKHSATKEIVTDIELLGLSIDKDTVLKHLRDAFRDLEIS